ncbi:thioredoxin-like domain-containing protein [Massariosphaeria phaeospora]|uniref:Thioredoxin-like domain-containing protein n=1 Tax=Massariosphaeria phaeospora TaxID=100035 RepID=A0A7C8MBE0_9PLEO|nr:thioredoxin-like domain-containing protein [Massariosphaeria phaeospora]
MVKTPFVIVDCEKEVELCKTYDINSYPTLRLFRKERHGKDGEDEELYTQVKRYRGRRTAHAIALYVRKRELPILTRIEPSDISSFKTIDDIVIIAYLRPHQDSLLSVFRSVAARNNENFVFGYSLETQTADNEGLAMPAIVAYRNADGDNKVLNGHFKEGDVESLLENARKSVIGEVTERNLAEYMVPAKLTLYIFTSTSGSATRLRHDLTPLAKKFEKFVIFGVADATEYAPMAKSFGLSNEGETAFPALAIHAPMNDNVFTYRQGQRIEKGVVEDMLTTILQGKAANGQIFGGGAARMDDGHDEL